MTAGESKQSFHMRKIFAYASERRQGDSDDDDDDDDDDEPATMAHLCASYLLRSAIVQVVTANNAILEEAYFLAPAPARPRCPVGIRADIAGEVGEIVQSPANNARLQCGMSMSPIHSRDASLPRFGVYPYARIPKSKPGD